MPTEDLRPLFTERTAAQVVKGKQMQPVTTSPQIILDHDAITLLRAGLGRYDMDIRWLAHLDELNILRLWRSWTGFQIYEVHAGIAPTGLSATLSELMVEQSPDRFSGSLTNEPALFERVLESTVNHLRRFRAGHTPYGPSANAGPEPEPWPTRKDGKGL